jgi:SAM-dependent methyltransferase
MILKYLKKILPSFIKRAIVNSNLFWQFRSKIFGKRVWYSYRDDFLSKRREFYSSFVSQNSCSSILDFGCASGTNLIRIERDHSNVDFSFLGIDISQDALQIAKKEIISKSKFSSKLTEENFEWLINSTKTGQVDLAIFDRVLTLLSTKEFEELFLLIKNKVEYLIIDDFYSEEDYSGELWTAKNYKKILENYGFELINKEKSRHKVTSSFHNEYAFILVFQKIKNLKI